MAETKKVDYDDPLPSRSVSGTIKSSPQGIFWQVLALSSLVKLAFIYSYRSTDFEVHRNWLAITYNLPISKWYLDETSEWTLDYPPLFAWFEFFLANIGVFIDPEMVVLNNLNYASSKTVIFQRLSVILSDVVLAYGLEKCCTYLKSHRSRKSSSWKHKWKSPTSIIQILTLGNVGLLIVDHIHFQYNGFLLGMFLLSTAEALEGNFLRSAFWYSVLINMKHIYLYMAPAYFIYFLRNFCFKNTSSSEVYWKSFCKGRFFRLASVVIGVTLISFGPFIYLGQLGQVMSRLFPLKRGLTHAYWAPNFWALYNFCDKILSFVGKLFGFSFSNGVMTGGLVQEYKHAVLPSVSATFTLILTVVLMAPCLVKLWKSPGIPLHFLRALVLCSSCSFIFGYHVHEKAILMTIIPLCLTSVFHNQETKIFILLSVVGHYSLLPLLFTPFEFYIKYFLYILYIIYLFKSCSDLLRRDKTDYALPFLSKNETLYIAGLVLIFLYEVLFHKLLNLENRYPFLNLMMISVYCAFGVIYSIFNYYYYFYFYDSNKYKSF